MDNKMTNVFKIPSHYVGNDCVQVRISYHNNLTIMDNNGIVFHSCVNKPETYVNNYLNDERNIIFPYSNIPSYKYREHWKNMVCVNQLFDFGKSYYLVGPSYGVGAEECVIKNGSSALLIKKMLKPRDCLTLRKRCEIFKIFEKNYIDEDIYYLSANGDLINDLNALIPDEKILNKMRINLIYGINHNKPIIIVRIRHGEFKIKAYMIDYIKEDCYRVNETDLPITKYTLSMIKELGCNIRDFKEPKISLRKNPELEKKDIIYAKNKVNNLRKIK